MVVQKDSLTLLNLLMEVDQSTVDHPGLVQECRRNATKRYQIFIWW